MLPGDKHPCLGTVYVDATAAVDISDLWHCSVSGVPDEYNTVGPRSLVNLKERV